MKSEESMNELVSIVENIINNKFLDRVSSETLAACVVLDLLLYLSLEYPSVFKMIKERIEEISKTETK